MGKKTRKTKDLIDAFVQYSQHTEVPTLFAKWIAVSAISGSLSRDCFIDQGFFTVYPNMYIVLVAGSARCRKSTAIGMAEDFMRQVRPEINLLSQKMTPEALIAALSGYSADGTDKALNCATGTIIVDELSVFIDKNAFKNGMIALLTKLYDSRDFEYLTLKRGKDTVTNPCVSLLGGSTIEWIRESIPEVAIGGGFTSRIIFVYQDKRERVVAWPTIDKKTLELKDHIINDLCQVANMRGGFSLTEAAIKAYSEEYERFYNDSPLMDITSLGGYANRRHTTLLKLSMITSASRSNELVINEIDMKRAIEMMNEVEVHVIKVMRAIATNEIGDVFEEIIKYIAKYRTVTKSELIRQFRHKLTAQELDVMMDTLEQEGIIQAVTTGARGVRYVFSGIDSVNG